MTDYLALAMEQWEEVSAIMAEELSTAAVGTPGGHLFRMEKTPPRPPEKLPEGVFGFTPSGLPLETTKRQGLRPLPFENPPGAVLFQRVSGEGSLRNAPAANLAKLNTAGASRSAAVFDGLLPGSGSGAGGAILTSLISRKQKGQKGCLGEAGGPFFGLSKNGPPGETALPLEGEFPPGPLGRDAPSPREEAVLPLLRQMRQAQWSTGFVQSQRRQFTVALPEAVSTVPPLSAEDLDLACERDARRYGGGFALY